MVSVRPTTTENIPSNEPMSFSSLVWGETGQQNHLDSDKCDDNVSKSFCKKFFGLKPRLSFSFSFRRLDVQPNMNEKNHNTKSDGIKMKSVIRKVHFAQSPNIHVYEANPGNSWDIWWDHEELDLLRKETIAEDNASIKEYLIAYKRSFREIQCNDKVTSQNMADLVTGLNRGHRGLEIFTSLQQVERRNENKSATASVVELHRRQGMKSHDTTSKLIRAHSIALTSRSRHWAQAMGKADMYAANNAQKTNEEFSLDD